MKKTLTAIVMSAALGLSALAGCGSNKEIDPQAVTGQYTVKVPKHDGELTFAGLTSAGQRYIVFKNADGTITTYSGDVGNWHRCDYQK